MACPPLDGQTVEAMVVARVMALRARRPSAVTVARPDGYALAVGDALMMVMTTAEVRLEARLAPLLGSMRGYRLRKRNYRSGGARRVGRVGGPWGGRPADLRTSSHGATRCARDIREMLGRAVCFLRRTPRLNMKRGGPEAGPPTLSEGTLRRGQRRQQRCQLCPQRQQSEQVKGKFNRQPVRSQFNSVPLVIGHLGNSSLTSPVRVPNQAQGLA
jgi:hypothetical protein